MDIYENILKLKRNNQSFVVATVVKASGSVPGKVGFKMVVTQSRTIHGTVGGGEIENRAVQESLNRLKTNDSGLKEYILQAKEGRVTRDDAEVVPMMCNGKVWIYYDVNQNKTPVYIFGGGHVGQALSCFLQKLNYHLILVDNREEFISEEKNPCFDEKHFAEYPDFARSFKPTPDSFIVIVTQGHGFDYDVLKILYQRKLLLKYIGIIASKSKSAGLLKQLKQDFGEKTDISKLFTPIGLKIGGNTENEIALSIASEIQAVRYGKETVHLRRVE